MPSVWGGGHQGLQGLRAWDLSIGQSEQRDLEEAWGEASDIY